MKFHFCCLLSFLVWRMCISSEKVFQSSFDALKDVFVVLLRWWLLKGFTV